MEKGMPGKQLLRNFFSFGLLFAIWFLWPFSSYSEEVLTWRDCVLEARRSNPDLLAAQAQIYQARAQRRIALSPMLPQISGFAGASRNGSDAYPNSESYSYGISASQLLFDAFKTSNSVSAADEAVRSAGYAYALVSADVRQRLRRAFVNLLKAQEMSSISEKIAERRRKNLELVRLRYQAGREHKGAVLAAEANLAQAESDLAQTRRAIFLAQQALSKEMGRQRYSAVRASGELSLSAKPDSSVDFDALAARSPALLQYSALKEQARFSLKAARADLAPRFYANASAGRSATEWPPDSDEWTIGLNVTLPIFEGGVRQAEIARARAALSAAEANEKACRDSVVLGLVQAWTDFVNAVDQVSVQEKFFEAAQARATIARAQYSSGIISFDTWTIIEDDLVRAEKAFLNAKADALLSEAGWINAQGGTLEDAE